MTWQFSRIHSRGINGIGRIARANRAPPGWFRTRRGSVYAMVLGIAMLITVIGIGALATARVTTRATDTSSDWVEAGEIAFSAAEHAIAKLNSDATAAPATWRNAYVSGTVAFDQTYGRGRMRWMLVDEDDGLFSDDYGDKFKLYGIGNVGTTIRVYSVMLIVGGPALDVLRTGCHAAGNLSIAGTTLAINGPVSANGNFALSGILRGTSEIAGSGGTSSPAKIMPSPSVWDYYAGLATRIPSFNISDGKLKNDILSAASNPYGEENPSGIYIIQIPESVSELSIEKYHVKGTLLIENATSRTNQALTISKENFLEPDRADLPTLITRGLRTVTIDGSIKSYSDSGTEYPSEVRGLMHCIGTTTVNLLDGSHIRGTLVCDGTLTLTGVVGFTVDPRLITKPPQGYTTGNVISPLRGSWKWDAPPPGV